MNNNLNQSDSRENIVFASLLAAMLNPGTPWRD